MLYLNFYNLYGHLSSADITTATIPAIIKCYPDSSLVSTNIVGITLHDTVIINGIGYFFLYGYSVTISDLNIYNTGT